MVFIPPIPLIRRNRIIKLLMKERAFSKETAKYLDEIGLINPYSFSGITKRLVKNGTICKTSDGRYYLPK